MTGYRPCPLPFRQRSTPRADGTTACRSHLARLYDTGIDVPASREQLVEYDVLHDAVEILLSEARPCIEEPDIRDVVLPDVPEVSSLPDAEAARPAEEARVLKRGKIGSDGIIAHAESQSAERG